MTAGPLENYPFKIILASASPRRRELLAGLGVEFTVKPAHAEEVWPEQLRGSEIALFLAKLKSEAYSEELQADELLITADTIVWCNEKIYNKPADFDEGVQMLRSLSGKMHEVFTGVCIRTAKKEVTFYDATKVYFTNLGDEEIKYYLEKYRPYDKAGAYGVQEWIGYVAIAGMEGSFYNVMGLPVQRVYEELIRFKTN